MSGSPFAPPLLPLLLWRTPPGLEMILAQEGIAFRSLAGLGPPELAQGRFVLFDGRRTTERRLAAALGPGHAAIDVDALRHGGRDPFAELLDTRAVRARWELADATPQERIARVDRAALREELLERLRSRLRRAGGVWVRLGAFPHPYRSAFNLRIDLDEPYTEEYEEFARLRTPLEDCTTHFVSTNAYGSRKRVLADLRDRDAQSHGHFHVVFRSAAANRASLARADARLRAAKIVPCGFAAPEGRWNAGLDAAVAGLGYAYSSDFQLGRDDLPFYPWLGRRFSPVLQVPIHPVCEGIFFEARLTDGRRIADYFETVIAAKIAAGEPAFVYGHPEHRLTRLPEVVDRMAGTIRGGDLLWRVTLTEFARWWRWRGARRWSLQERGPDRYEAQFEEADATYTPALELLRAGSLTRLPAHSSRVPIVLGELARERRPSRAVITAPRPIAEPFSTRRLLRWALDWETVTPLAELPAHTPRAAMKKILRAWRERGRA